MIQALGNHLLVRPIPETKKIGVTEINLKSKIISGEVLSVGSGVEEVKAGDFIALKNSGNYRKEGDNVYIPLHAVEGIIGGRYER